LAQLQRFGRCRAQREVEVKSLEVMVMKRIASTLGTLALALSLGVPAFAATAARPQTAAKTTAAKPSAKSKTAAKKSIKTTRKAAPASAKSAVPQNK
jgi:hypothetical protein